MSKNIIFDFTDEEVGIDFDYGPVAKALRKLKKKPNADKARQILARHGCNCKTAATILHDLGLIPNLLELELAISSQAITCKTRKLKATWSCEEVDGIQLMNKDTTSNWKMKDGIWQI